MEIPKHTLQYAINYFREKLIGLYGESELEQLLQLSFLHLFQLSRVQLTLEGDEHFSTVSFNKMLDVIEELKLQKPLAYILGEWEFYGLVFKVNEHTLIPRPETEELVQLIVTENPEVKSIIDIGTGSGCIALALKSQITKATVFAWDVSEKALEIVKGNATLNKLAIEIEQVDILKSKHNILQQKVDVIVSNPPYIPNSENALMKTNVLDFEPHLALFVENDNPLLFYNTIADFALINLNSNGKMYFEINENYGATVQQLLVAKGFKNVNIVKDMNEKDRIISSTI